MPTNNNQENLRQNLTQKEIVVPGSSIFKLTMKKNSIISRRKFGSAATKFKT